MRGNTFNALTMGQIATVWNGSEYNGKCGTIVGKTGIGNKGKGWVGVKFADGQQHTTPFDKVALGDNSNAE